MKNQNALSVILCPLPIGPRPIDGNNIEDFRSLEFKDSVIFIVPLDTSDERADHGPYTNRTYPLIRNGEIKIGWCDFCNHLLDGTTEYYVSGEFDRWIFEGYVGFHKKCIELMGKNPYHPKHSLQILIYRYIYVVANKLCCSCYCYKDSFLYCSICDFRICSKCVQEPPLLTIEQKKRHEHTLFYIPREASMTCDVCAFDDRRYFIYICHQCDFVVHKECIYFPYIIKISRHGHRLSFTSSFLHGNWFCGICRKNIDGYYGGYSCVKGCCYGVHSRCAINNNVWDGKELEGEPEDIFDEDIMPFKEICDGVIQHFSHNHYMKLRKVFDKAYKEKFLCQACTLPLYDDDIFSCVECDFILHKICANLPMKKQHAMHPHPLVLQEGSLQTKFYCSACHRVCNSFRYECESRECRFYLDVHCASISEPLDHHFHIHPLFFPSKYGSSAICSICQGDLTNHLECGKCDFALCFECATLPKEFMYKYDEHPLIFSFGQEASSQYWCDMCEKKINPKHGTYMCNDCDVTLHIECLLGEDMYMLPGKMVNETTTSGDEINNNILLNNHLTRDICKYCHKRCQNKTIYKSFNGAICCSLSCLYPILGVLPRMLVA